MHVKPSKIEKILQKRSIKTMTRETMQKRKIYDLGNILVEVVHPVENTEFCAFCNRIRLGNDGSFKPCLMRNDNKGHSISLVHIKQGKNNFLGPRIHGRCCLIQDEYGGSPVEGPDNGHSLTFSAGEVESSFGRRQVLHRLRPLLSSADQWCHANRCLCRTSPSTVMGRRRSRSGPFHVRRTRLW